MGTRPAGRHTASGGDNVLRAQVAVDDDPDDDPEDVDAVFAGVDVLEPLDDSDAEVDDDPPSFFFVSPEPAPSEATGVEAPLDAARESVL